jgi:DNA mismatch endonuclease, patch repair protein
MMAGIKGKNIRPERILRSFLHREGFRCRLHPDNLPCRPDLIRFSWKGTGIAFRD